MSKEEKKIEQLLGFDEETLPNKDFMVTILLNIDSEHKIFKKDYIKKMHKKEKNQKLFFPKDFFDSVPDLDPSKKKSWFSLLPKKEKETYDIELLEGKMKTLAEKLKLMKA